jgi:hypothetical protein
MSGFVHYHSTKPGMCQTGLGLSPLGRMHLPCERHLLRLVEAAAACTDEAPRVSSTNKIGRRRVDAAFMITPPCVRGPGMPGT